MALTERAGQGQAGAGVALRRLGRSSLRVSPIGLGTWQFSQGHGYAREVWATLDQATIDAVVAAALGGGITWFDTAEAYGSGRSELALSTALHHLRIHPARITIADKWFPLARTAGSIAGTIDDRLRHLQGYPIGLYQIHWPWSLSRLGSQMRAMAGLVRAGTIAAVGVSNFSAAQMVAAREALRREGLTLASNQVRLNLLDRRVEHNDVLAAARELGVSLIAYSPLAQGLLTGRWHTRPGAAHAAAAAAAQRLVLSAAELAELAELSGPLARRRAGCRGSGILRCAEFGLSQSALAVPWRRATREEGPT